MYERVLENVDAALEELLGSTYSGDVLYGASGAGGTPRMRGVVHLDGRLWVCTGKGGSGDHVRVARLEEVARDTPLVGPYGVQDHQPGDHYKGVVATWNGRRFRFTGNGGSVGFDFPREAFIEVDPQQPTIGTIFCFHVRRSKQYKTETWRVLEYQMRGGHVGLWGTHESLKEAQSDLNRYVQYHIHPVDPDDLPSRKRRWPDCPVRPYYLSLLMQEQIREKFGGDVEYEAIVVEHGPEMV